MWGSCSSQRDSHRASHLRHFDTRHHRHHHDYRGGVRMKDDELDELLKRRAKEVEGLVSVLKFGFAFYLGFIFGLVFCVLAG